MLFKGISNIFTMSYRWSHYIIIHFTLDFKILIYSFTTDPKRKSIDMTFYKSKVWRAIYIGKHTGHLSFDLQTKYWSGEILYKTLLKSSTRECTFKLNNFFKFDGTNLKRSWNLIIFSSLKKWNVFICYYFFNAFFLHILHLCSNFTNIIIEL
jgi:hypothetical protein